MVAFFEGNMIKEIYKRILFYASVPKCVNCESILDYEDECFCKECRPVYEEFKLRNCALCSRPLTECSCSNKYMRSCGIKSVIKVYRYRAWEKDIPSNKIIYSLKEQNRSDVFDFLASELYTSITNSLTVDKDKFVIVNIPRRSKSIIDFGYDHAREIAKRLAKRLDIDYIPVLKSLSKKAQKETIGSERATNAVFAFRKKHTARLKGKIVIIVDDIITTGSSMVSAAKLLRKNGARKTIAATIAIAYKNT